MFLAPNQRTVYHDCIINTLITAYTLIHVSSTTLITKYNCKVCKMVFILLKIIKVLYVECGWGIELNSIVLYILVVFDFLQWMFFFQTFPCIICLPSLTYISNCIISRVHVKGNGVLTKRTEAKTVFNNLSQYNLY